MEKETIVLPKSWVEGLINIAEVTKTAVNECQDVDILHAFIKADVPRLLGYIESVDFAVKKPVHITVGGEK